MASGAERRGRRRGDAHLRRLRRGHACPGGRLPDLSTDPTLRLALCVADEHALRVARRCALRAGAADVLALDARGGAGLAERATLLRAVAPDALLVVGSRQRARDLVEVVEAARAASRGAPDPPRLVIAGDNALQAELQHAAAGELGIVRVAPSEPAIAATLRALRRVEEPLAVEDLESRARALAATAILACDVGGGSTRVAFSDGADVVAVELPAYGLAEGGDALARAAGPEALRRWLPFALDPAALLDRVANAARFGTTVDPAAVALRVALAREALRAAIAPARDLFASPALERPRVVALFGELAAFSEWALAAVLDGLQPSGAFEVLADGAPLAVVVAHAADRGASVRVRDEDGDRDLRVRSGELARFGLRGRAWVRVSGTRLAIEGRAGPLGLVVDARPRPLALPEREAERQRLVASWAKALGLPA